MCCSVCWRDLKTSSYFFCPSHSLRAFTFSPLSPMWLKPTETRPRLQFSRFSLVGKGRKKFSINFPRLILRENCDFCSLSFGEGCTHRRGKKWVKSWRKVRNVGMFPQEKLERWNWMFELFGYFEYFIRFQQQHQQRSNTSNWNEIISFAKS